MFYNNSQMVPPHGKGSNNEAGGNRWPTNFNPGASFHFVMVACNLA
jgi:hypothetical protein